MQNPFQPPRSVLEFAIVLPIAFYSYCCARSEPFLAPAPTHLSEVQFLYGGRPADNSFYEAGLKILLVPGAITYWRMPGYAGVPPVFSFEGSKNLGKAQLFFPVPQRLEEAGETAFGYKDRVIFPLHIHPAEPSKSVELSVKLDYAVCAKICLPETARFRVELGPGQTISHSAEAELHRAEMSLPKPLSLAEIAAFTRLAWAEEESQKTGLPAWKLTWRGAPPADLFVEAPNGWYFKTEKTSDPEVFLLTALDHPQTGAEALKAEVTVTLLEKDHCFEFNTELKTPSGPN